MQINFCSLEGVKLISSTWFVVCLLQSDELTWIQVKYGSINKSDHMVGDKFIESFFDLHQGWNFLEYKFLSIGDVTKGYQTNDIVGRKLSFY